MKRRETSAIHWCCLLLGLAAWSVAPAASSRARAATPRTESATRIEEARFVSLGGIEQWITIRGDRRSDPVILILHGGPAEAQSPLVATYAQWEKSFIVVQWDQRGAGRTFGRMGTATTDMTLARMVADTIDLADYLRGYLRKDKVILLGHSWGSFLGVHAVMQRPELFAAFVGTGQVQSWRRTVELQYDYALQRAQADSNQAALDDLSRVGPPPYKDLLQYSSVRKWLNTSLAPADAGWLNGQSGLFRSALGADSQALADLQAGARFSLPLLLPVLFSMDLPALGDDFPVPFIVIQGADDVIAPTTAAKEYFKQLRAPWKKFIAIDEAGHFAAMTHTRQFLRKLVKYARPFAAHDFDGGLKTSNR